MENIFKDTYFGKAYKTRGGKRAIYQNGDDELHHLFLSSCDILVDSYGYINCKELPSGLDIVSEWQEEISEEELDRLAEEEYPYEYTSSLCASEEADYKSELREAFKAGFRKAMEYLSNNEEQ